jgi:hypothetical protein
MIMTRKDYQLIADCIGMARAECNNTDEEIGLDRAVDNLSVALEDDNPRFDKDKFDKACGGY